MGTILDGDKMDNVTNLKECLLKLKTAISVHLFLRIFQLTFPLSNYLQTTGMDLFNSQKLVMETVASFENLLVNLLMSKIKAVVSLPGQTNL